MKICYCKFSNILRLFKHEKVTPQNGKRKPAAQDPQCCTEKWGKGVLGGQRLFSATEKIGFGSGRLPLACMICIVSGNRLTKANCWEKKGKFWNGRAFDSEVVWGIGHQRWIGHAVDISPTLPQVRSTALHTAPPTVALVGRLAGAGQPLPRSRSIQLLSSGLDHTPPPKPILLHNIFHCALLKPVDCGLTRAAN